MSRRLVRLALRLLLSGLIAGGVTWGFGATWRAIGGGAMSIHGWIALFIGTFGTVALAWALMALAFRSSRDGWDQRAARPDGISSPDPSRPSRHN